MLDDCETPLMVWKWTLTGLAAAPYYAQRTASVLVTGHYG